MAQNAVLPIALVAAATVVAIAGSSADDQVGAAFCSCELRSWIVAGRGRHMFVRVDCPPGLDHLDTVVEFTSAAMRRDFVGPIDPSNLPRVAKMTRGVRLAPAFGNAPDDRLELKFSLDAGSAREFQRDRLFSQPYVLLGANSNAAMRAALASVGVETPEHVRMGGGLQGEFPGIDFDPGETLPAERWGEFNLPRGPEPAPGASRE